MKEPAATYEVTMENLAEAPTEKPPRGNGSDLEAVVMPRRLTAENGAKALMAGEFFERIFVRCDRCDGDG